MPQEDLFEAGWAAVQRDRARLLNRREYRHEAVGAHVAGQAGAVDVQIEHVLIGGQTHHRPKRGGHDLGAGQVAKLLEGPGLDHAAAADDRDAIGDRLDLTHDVAGQQDGAAFGPDLGHALAVHLRHQGVQAVGGFVEQVQRHIGSEGRDQGDLLLVALGVGADLLTGVQVEPFDEFVTAHRLDLAHPQQEIDGLATGQLRPQFDVTGHVGHVLVQAHRVLPWIHSQDADDSLVALHQTEQDPQHGRLAGAVGPQEGVNLPLGHLDLEVIERLSGREGLANGTRGDHWFGHAGQGRSRTGMRRRVGGNVT